VLLVLALVARPLVDLAPAAATPIPRSAGAGDVPTVVGCTAFEYSAARQLLAAAG
jgi:hypothetical protein